jgi:hypothetical protein
MLRLRNEAAPAMTPSASAGPRRPFLVDGHVHIHPSYDLDEFLETAAQNLRHAALALGLPDTTPACLMLAESAHTDRFAELRGRGSRGRRGWEVTATGEDVSLMARRDGQPPLFVVAGSQIVTRERLEVLALACSRRIPDGWTLGAVVDDVLAAGAIAVVPWGFGKWWFKRGTIVRNLIASPRGSSLYLGDNGGRLSWTPRPRLFEVARAKGIRVLPGSDALPLSGQQGKVGRFGFVLEGSLDPQAPARAVAACLAGTRAQPRAFGRREHLPGFVRSQIAMQLRGRRETRSA